MAHSTLPEREKASASLTAAQSWELGITFEPAAALMPRLYVCCMWAGMQSRLARHCHLGSCRRLGAGRKSCGRCAHWRRWCSRGAQQPVERLLSTFRWASAELVLGSLGPSPAPNGSCAVGATQAALSNHVRWCSIPANQATTWGGSISASTGLSHGKGDPYL